MNGSLPVVVKFELLRCHLRLSFYHQKLFLNSEALQVTTLVLLLYQLLVYECSEIVTQIYFLIVMLNKK